MCVEGGETFGLIICIKLNENTGFHSIQLKLEEMCIVCISELDLLLLLLNECK